MAKTKTPFFSLGSHGTIGNAITSQKRGSNTLIRAKPVPAYRRTLLQQYQRWLYEDYVAYWHDQTVAVKRTWETNARPHHMTGFAYWMQYHLLNMPDIAGMWHLDTIFGSTVKDYSKNLNHGTVYGPLLTDGLIDHALSFDGVDDYVQAAHSSSLAITTLITLEAFIYWHEHETYNIIIEKGQGIHYTLYAYELTNSLRFHLVTDISSLDTATPNNTLSHDSFHYIAATYDGSNKYMQIDDHLYGPYPQTGLISSSSVPLQIGRRLGGPPILCFCGNIDEPRIYNRVLTPSDILRHSLRRYPS